MCACEADSHIHSPTIQLISGFEDLTSYQAFLRTAPEFSPASEVALLAHYRDITGRIAPEMLKLFHVRDLPRTPFRITPTPEASAATAPAAYYLAGAGDRPGTFYANCSELESRRMYECEVSDSGDYMWFWRGCEKYS